MGTVMGTVDRRQDMTLTEFLLARIAEDEQWAKDNPHFVDAPAYVPPWWTRALVETEVKRWLVEDHSATVECGNIGCERAGLSGLHCTSCDEAEPCPTLRRIASVYADHPDYRAEWADAS